jgi:GNAT superfamily N-acetyltransferase
VEYEVFSPGKIPTRVAEFSKKVQARYGLRQLEVKRASQLKPYARQIFQLVNEAYSHLYGFVELTEKQIQFYTDQYFGYVNPEFVSTILNQQNEVIGFGLTMPSLSRALQKANGRLFPFGFWHLYRALQKNDRADFYIIALRPEFRSKGVHVMILEKILTTCMKYGIPVAETNPELETNLQVQLIWKGYERRQHKRRRCYSKELA